MLHAIADASVIGTVVALLFSCVTQRIDVRRFATSALGSKDPTTLDGVLTVCAAVLAGVPKEPDDRSFVLVPGLSALGASPGTIIREGGCCSGKSRLTIVAYRSLGLDAAQITLYHRSGRAQHCAVEVVFADGPVIVDPLYGLYYVDSEGAPIGLDALRRGTPPAFRPIPGSKRRSYPGDPYYDFDYPRTGTANWTATRARRCAHSILSVMTRARVDTTRQPAALEWPQLILSACLGALFALAHAVALTGVRIFPQGVFAALILLPLPLLIVAGSAVPAFLRRGRSTSVASRVAVAQSGLNIPLRSARL